VNPQKFYGPIALTEAHDDLSAALDDVDMRRTVLTRW
jgi:hypothetical protein